MTATADVEPLSIGHASMGFVLDRLWRNTP
jgi:hypothetical protein